MSAYWRSPYREPTNSFRNPNHSTLKFEQSLYLSRSRTSIHSAKYDWLDAALNSHSDKNIKPNHLVRSNTTIKSILKTGKDADTSISGESTTHNKEMPKKDPKKKVTFGLNENIQVECDGTQSSIYLRNRKYQLATMHRISQSKLLEETALEKLNRLMGTSSQSTSLPSVMGKGLLSPRSATARCNHSSDLKCRRCLRKDLDIDDKDKPNSKLHLDKKFESIANETNGNNDKSVVEKSKSLSKYQDMNVEERLTEDPVQADNKENDNAEGILSNREGVQNYNGICLPTSGSDNAKKHFRLLPGRYPFSTGAMQIEKILISNGQENKSGDSSAGTMEEVNVIDLQKGQLDSRNKNSNDESPNSPSLRKTPRGANDNGRTNKVPAIVPSSAPHENGVTTADKGVRNEKVMDDLGIGCKKKKPSKEKTSRILDWLNDVNQKQTFKPGLAHLYALESR